MTRGQTVAWTFARLHLITEFVSKFLLLVAVSNNVSIGWNDSKVLKTSEGKIISFYAAVMDCSCANGYQERKSNFYHLTRALPRLSGISSHQKPFWAFMDETLACEQALYMSAEYGEKVTPSNTRKETRERRTFVVARFTRPQSMK